MKNHLPQLTSQKLRIITRIISVLVLAGFLGLPAFSQITNTTPASRCGEGTLVLSATATTGTIKWYDVPFYGTALETGASFTTPLLAVTKTYYVDAVDGANCSLNSGSARVQVIATVSANSIQAGIFYSSNTFCKSVSGEQLVTRTGTAGGTFTVSPTGLSLNASTGAITPGNSTNGTYTVTYTVTAAEGCTENPASTGVTITNAPVQPVISYTGSPYCTTATPVSVSQTGAGPGTYSASPSGLTINTSDGTITPASSSSGTYTITYFVPGAGGCDPRTATATITILRLPTATISYATPFTKNQGTQLVILSGTGVYTGGVFSSTTGLAIDASTGAITPASSTAGTYSVTYTLAAVTPCAKVTANATVTIRPQPTAGITGTQSVCQNSTAPDVTFTGADGLAPYTFTYKIGTGDNQTVTTTSGNSVTVSQPTSVINTYIYTLISVTDANSSMQLQSGTATITINTQPVALFEYGLSPYCSNSANPIPTMLEGGARGIFTASSGSLSFVSETTGEINLSTSAAGTYTVTNTITGTAGCSTVNATADITITKLPVATFTYTGTPYCQNASNPAPAFTGGGAAGTFTSGAGLLFISAATGVIDIANSTPGIYQVTNTFTAASGCDLVAVTSPIMITVAPVQPTIAYGGTPFCSSETNPQKATQTGTTGGVYSYTGTGSLVLNTTSGDITPNGSTVGTYTVTYTIAAAGGCSQLTATTGIVIQQAPAASISYTSASYCNSAAPVTPVLTGTTGGSYSATPDGGRMIIGAGLIIDATTGVITPVGSYPETYNVFYVVSGCSFVTATTQVTIYALPTASASGTATICNGSTTAISIALTGAQPWSFTYTDGTTSVSITDQATSPYTFNVTPGSEKTYLVTAVSDIHCSGSDFGTSAIITVDPTSVPGTVTGGTTICSGSTSGVLTLGTHTGTITKWQSSLDGTTWTTIENTLATYTSGALTATTQFRAVVKSGVCSEDYSVATTVTVNAITLAPTGSASQTFCSGSGPV